MTQKTLIALGLALAAAAAPGLSSAACNISGVVVRVTAYDDAYSTTSSFIYFRTSSLSPSYYYVTTNDDEMTSNAIAYMDSGRTANIQGNVATCPAAPAAGGAASLGSLNYLYNP